MRRSRAGWVVGTVLAVGGLVSLPAAAVELRGRVVYENPVPGRAGFVAVGTRPAAGLLVELFELGQSSEIVGVLETDADGVLAADVVGLDVGDLVGLRLTARNAAVEVVDALGAPYQWATLGQATTIDADPFDLGTLAIGREQDAGALNILHVVTVAHGRAAVRVGRAASAVQVRWQRGVVDGCGSCYADGVIRLLSQGEAATADTDEFDDHVILHEYAHHLAHDLGCDESPGGAHAACDSGADPRLAWSEGWASYLAVETAVGEAAADDLGSVYLDTAGNPSAGSTTLLAIDLEDNELCGDGGYGPGSEAAVALALWDLQDAPLDPPDDYERAPAEVFATAIDELPSRGSCDVRGFLDAWCARRGEDVGAFAPLFGRFALPLPSACPLRYGLRVERTGNGDGRVTTGAGAGGPAGLDCGVACVASLAPGTVVELLATAAPGSSFAGFGGDPDCADGRLTMEADRSCIARFERPGGCVAGPYALCLLGGRFRVTAEWENQYSGARGSALARRYTDLTGFLAFDDPANLELVVKLLDFGDAIKLFYGQLTDLRFTLTVTEVATGRSKRYRNGAGNCGAIDQAVLAPGVGAGGTGGGGDHVAWQAGAAPTAACVADADTLCLLGGRYAVEVDWRNQFDGSTGSGRPQSLSDLSGLFTFTDPANVELLAKVLDFGDRTLVLWGALSDLGYTLRLTDTVTGASASYEGVPGRYCGGLDPDAF